MTDRLHGASLTGPLNGADIIHAYEGLTGESIFERLWRLPRAESPRNDDEERAEDAFWSAVEQAAIKNTGETMKNLRNEIKGKSGGVKT